MTVSTTSSAAGAPEDFLRAVAGLGQLDVRAELELGSLPAPVRLAPWAHAVSATIHAPGTDDEIGSGRLVLLHDPDGVIAWDGTLRIVIFATCEVEGEIARDPLLPEVAWSWLTESLESCGASFTALGGTVTATSSVRFGDIAGATRSDDVEIRASWTPLEIDTSSHMQAFLAFLAVAAGLPPEGVSPITPMGFG